VTPILILLIFSLIARWALRGRQTARGWLLLAASGLAVFYIQPAVAVRGLDFWLPVASLTLAAVSWLLTSTPEARASRENWPAAAVLAGIVLLAGALRYIYPEPLLTASLPPHIGRVLAGLAVAAAVALLVLLLARRGTRWLAGGLVIFLILLFIAIKTPALAALASAGLRALAGQNPTLAAAGDIRWLGFSYLAFRLIHTARDRQSGRLPAVTLREYVTYALFYPALSAGPVARLERFLKDLRAPFAPDAAGLLLAGQRLAVGLFKKFVVADALAMIALNPTNALQVQSGGWAWVLVYAYALQIFFDFSGYTDIAIGLGLLLGIKLPENFNAPYLKPNLTQFWNSWHMTLTQWFRAYYFNPLARWLRTRPVRLPPAGMIFFTQVTTMILIGLWHGVTWNFVLWGAWHGLGMFVHNRWSDYAREHIPPPDGPRAALLNGLSVLATFHFVALGWVFFALPDVSSALRVFGLLF
jgi:D-alanyl-lipoteichoic acid acyltransferase DltB (MBOAT superfamily)